MVEDILSPGVRVAWQLAADLAVHEQASFIQPRHLLYGICSLEKLLSAPSDKSQSPERELARPEAEQLSELAKRHGVSLATMRRALRAPVSDIVRDSPAAGKRILSRSPSVKRIFEIAAKTAAAADSPQTDLPFLTQATLQIDDPDIETATAGSKQSLLGMLNEWNKTLSDQTPQFVLSLDSGLQDLDESPEASRTVLQIAETLDAGVAVEPDRSQARDSDAMERLALLSELTWEFGTQGPLDPMLSKIVDRLLRSMPTAERCVILIREADTGDLLLKACGPAGKIPMISMTSAKRAIAEKRAFVWKRGEDLTLSQKESEVQSGIYAPLVVNGDAIGVICLDCFCPRQSFSRNDLLLVTSFAHQLALAIANRDLQSTLKQNADVLQRLLTNFSPQVRTRLLQRARLGRLRLGGEQSVVSVLCADVRGFTRLSATMPTEDVVSLLNEYFAALTECIFRHDGTVDKFIGDAILAVFGSPEADPQHCRKAVVAGMKMQQAAEDVSRRRIARGDVRCHIGIGIHTGEVLHGFIGSPERMEYTIIGDAVNRATRYCDAAKVDEVLISPEIHQRVYEIVDVQQISIPTKHEGEFIAYRINQLRERR